MSVARIIPSHFFLSGSPHASSAIPRAKYVSHSEMQKCEACAAASLQFDSATPKFSSIASERNHPGVTPTGVQVSSLSSAVSGVTVQSRVDENLIRRVSLWL